jgi:hypothetical protein
MTLAFRKDIKILCSIYIILSRVRVFATVINCCLRIWSLYLLEYSVITAVVHFINVQHINQRLVFWYHFTFDCSGSLLSGVFLALIFLLWSVDFSCPLGLLWPSAGQYRRHHVEPFNFLFSDTTMADVFVTAETEIVLCPLHRKQSAYVYVVAWTRLSPRQWYRKPGHWTVF